MEPIIEPGQRFRASGPDIVAESIDGEVIIINLDSGAYYSSTGSGERIWRAFSDGLSVLQTTNLLCAEHDAEQQMVERCVIDFARDLYREGLIAEDPDAGPVEIEPTTAAGKPFEPPTLEKYTDMQELLLLDPIHDIDPSVGWPVTKPAE